MALGPNELSKKTNDDLDQNKKVSFLNLVKQHIKQRQSQKGRKQESEVLERLRGFVNKIEQLPVCSVKTLCDELIPFLPYFYMAKDKLSKNFSAHILSLVTPINRGFVIKQFINELEFYEITRRQEAVNSRGLHRKLNLSTSYNTFFGKIFGCSAQTKLTAVDKLIKTLKGEYHVGLALSDLVALRSGHLADIVSKYEALGVLPKAVIDAEQACRNRIEARIFTRA